MFGDGNWIYDKKETRAFHKWEDAVQQILKEDEQSKFVILEIGCGMNVTTVRSHSERVLSAFPKGQCTLIRVNPDFPEVKGMKENFISIRAKGLATVKKIDSLIRKKQKEKSET